MRARSCNGSRKKEPGAQPGAEAIFIREREILRLLARGFAYQEMADAPGVSLGTINTHIRRMYQKFNVSSRGEAVALLAPIPATSRLPDRPATGVTATGHRASLRPREDVTGRGRAAGSYDSTT